MKALSRLCWLLAMVMGLVLSFPTALPAQVQSAGQINRMIPDVNLQHGTRVQLAASGAKVLWGDLVSTDSEGRARIVLDDGSILNVGSNSQIRVVQHDSANQRTQVQLAYGRLRASAIRLARPGASFEVRTPTAVAGVVGTDFVMEYTDDITTVHVYEGAVNFCSLGAVAAGYQRWQPGVSYSSGAAVMDSRGNIQEAQNSGVSGQSAPDWQPSVGETTNDNGIAWLNKGAAPPSGAGAAGVLRCVTVAAGLSAIVRGNQAPSPATPTPPSAAVQSVQSTSVGGGAGGGGAGAAGAGGAGGGGTGAAAGAGAVAVVSHTALVVTTAIVSVVVPAVVVPVATKTTTCSSVAHAGSRADVAVLPCGTH